MNYFYTNDEPLKIALDHCTIHRNKMITEHLQMMSTCKRLSDGVPEKVWKYGKKIAIIDGIKTKVTVEKLVTWYTLSSDTFQIINGKRFITNYKVYAVTHKNHPSSKWVRESIQHFNHIKKTTIALCELFEADTGKVHKGSSIVNLEELVPTNILDKPFKRPPLSAEDEPLCADVCIAYQQYLNKKFKEWYNRPGKKQIIAKWWKSEPNWLKLTVDND